MFTTRDIEELVKQRESERQEIAERANKKPVYVRAVRFGDTIGYTLVLGEDFMGDKVAFYGYATVTEFYTKLDHAEILCQLLGLIKATASVAERRDGLWLFKDKTAWNAYLRYEDRREAWLRGRA